LSLLVFGIYRIKERSKPNLEKSMTRPREEIKAVAVIGLISILLERIFQIDLALNLIYGIIFIFIALLNSITLITGNMFLALRKGQYFFIQTILISLRLFLLIPLAYFKSYGIFLSLGICYLFSVIFSIWVLRKEVKINFFEIDRQFLKESFKFSIGSYFSNILSEAPMLIMPIMVLQLISQKEAARYYIAMDIGNLTLIVPIALSYSLFIEGSYGKSLKENIMKAFTTAYRFLIPMVVVIGLWGKDILNLINIQYGEAYNLLFMVTVTSFFAVIYLVFISVQNIKMQVIRNMKFNLLRFLILLGASYYLMPKYGIKGVGYVWLLTHVILVLLIPVSYIKKGLMKVLEKAERIEDDLTPKKIILTTGPVIRDLNANSLVVVVLNTTNANLEVKVAVNDLTEGRKKTMLNALVIHSNLTGAFTFPQPPELYEVFIEGICPGVYVWTSTSPNKKARASSLHENIFLTSNTFRHNDFISVPHI
jgi:O-antigen/teichoic acid export membrane protein